MSDAVLGAVLVGGGSRRMGEPKADLSLDGTPMAHRVRHALFDGGVGAVVLIGAPEDQAGSVADRWPGEGPLGGLATAVAHAAGLEGVEAVVVAACDQPDLTGALVAALLGALAGAPAEAVGAAVRTADGRRHPFPSAWRATAGPALAALVDAGSRRADAAFSIGPIVDIEAAEAALADLDTPDDVRRWTQRHRGDGGAIPEHRV